MLIRVTMRCQMQCSHCLVDARPNGAHISLETFHQALEFSVRLGDPIILLSGGEPTEHPRIVELIREAQEVAGQVVVITNGMWLHDPIRTIELLATGANFQVTNDPRFYPHRLPEAELETEQVTYVYRVTTMTRLGRYRDESNRLGPACFNLRSGVHAFGSFGMGVSWLRWEARKFCTPSIDIDGTIRAGESSQCFALGSIWSGMAELTEATLAHDCDRCGLHGRLPPEAREAINA